jgi:MFS family permease
MAAAAQWGGKDLLWLFLVGNFGTGLGYCLNFTGNHTFLVENIRPSRRGVAMSSTGGTHRLGGVIGPLLFALVEDLTGSLRWATAFLALPALAAALLNICFMPAPTEQNRHHSQKPKEEPASPVQEPLVTIEDSPEMPLSELPSSSDLTTKKARGSVSGALAPLAVDVLIEANVVGDDKEDVKEAKRRDGMFQVLYDYRKQYSTVGTFVFLMSICRAGR